MKDLEKQIEEAAREYAISLKVVDCYSSASEIEKYAESDFIAGAKSQAAKEYWQQGVYSEEEVKALVQKFNKEQCASRWYDDDEDWFNQNKKK